MKIPAQRNEPLSTRGMQLLVYANWRNGPTDEMTEIPMLSAKKGEENSNKNFMKIKDGYVTTNGRKSPWKLTMLSRCYKGISQEQFSRFSPVVIILTTHSFKYAKISSTKVQFLWISTAIGNDCFIRWILALIPAINAAVNRTAMELRFKYIEKYFTDDI